MKKPAPYPFTEGWDIDYTKRWGHLKVGALVWIKSSTWDLPKYGTMALVAEKVDKNGDVYVICTGGREFWLSADAKVCTVQEARWYGWCK